VLITYGARVDRIGLTGAASTLYASLNCPKAFVDGTYGKVCGETIVQGGEDVEDSPGNRVAGRWFPCADAGCI
jgi:hypothetical protein